MAAFDPTEYHSANYFTQNIVSSKRDGKMFTEQKVKKRGLRAWLSKVWRRLTQDDLHPETVRGRMVEVAKRQMMSNNDPQTRKLILLSNVYCNIANFDQAVIGNHNKKLFSYIFFWSRMSQAPKDLMTKLKGKVVELMDKTCEDLPRQSTNTMSIKGSLDQIEELKALLACAENVSKISPIDSNKINLLKAELATFLGRVSQQFKQEGDLLCNQVQQNAWNDQAEEKLKALNGADFVKITNWINQDLSQCPSALQVHANVGDVQRVVADTKARIALETQAVDQAVQMFQAKVAGVTRADLQNLTPAIDINRYNYLMNLTYVSPDKKQGLRNWNTHWETTIRTHLQEARTLFDGMDRLNDRIHQLSVDDFYPNSVQQSGFAFAPTNSRRLVTLETEKEAIAVRIRWMNSNCISKKINDELSQAYQTIDAQIRNFRLMARKKKESELVQLLMFDQARLTSNLRLMFTNEFNEQQPIEPQLKRLLRDPMTQFLEGLRANGRGFCDFAQSMAGPWEEIDRALNTQRAYLARLEQFQAAIKQVSLKNSAMGTTPLETRRQLQQIISQFNAQQLETLALLSPEERRNTVDARLVYNASVDMLVALKNNHGLMDQAINECYGQSRLVGNAAPDRGYFDRLWRYAAQWGNVIARHQANQLDYITTTRNLLTIIETPFPNQSRHPLFESVAYQEAKGKLHEIECIQKINEIQVRYAAHVDGNSSNPITFSEFINAERLIRESRELLAKVPADNHMAMLLNEKIGLLEGICQANRAAFSSLNNESDGFTKLVIDQINYQIKAAALKNVAHNQPQPIDPALYQRLSNNQALGAAKKQEIDQLKGLLDRLPNYTRSWEGIRTPGAVGGMTHEAPTKSPQADQDMQLLTKLTVENRLEGDVKTVVKLLQQMYALQLHPVTPCPITLMPLTEETAYIRTTDRNDASKFVDHYFNKAAIIQTLATSRNRKHPLTNEERIGPDRIIDSAAAQQLVLEYHQWCDAHGIAHE